jgi:hypothetical protein
MLRIARRVIAEPIGGGNRRKWDGSTLAERIADDALRDSQV